MASFAFGDSNATVVKSEDVDGLIGMFGENTCNSNGNIFIELLQNCNLIVCNDRT